MPHRFQKGHQAVHKLVEGDPRLYRNPKKKPKAPVSTAEQFQNNYPDRYSVVIDLLATGRVSDEEISKKVKCAPQTVRQVRLTRIDDIMRQREYFRKNMFVVAALGQDKMIELMPKCDNLRDATIATGVAMDKFLAVSGLPVAKIQVDHNFNMKEGLAELKEILEKAQDKGEKIIRGEIIEETPALTNGEEA